MPAMPQGYRERALKGTQTYMCERCSKPFHYLKASKMGPHPKVCRVCWGIKNGKGRIRGNGHSRWPDDGGKSAEQQEMESSMRAREYDSRKQGPTIFNAIRWIERAGKW